MPYGSIEELPKGVKDVLPEHGQEIYKDALNNAEEEYRDPSKRRGDESAEETARRVAWAAVENTYEKSADGVWREK